MNGFPQNLISSGKNILLGIKELKHLSLSRLRKVFSLMGKREKIALAILLGLAIVSFMFSGSNFYYAHTRPLPAEGGTYNEGMLGQPTYINPLLARAEPDLTLTNLIFSGLYKFDPNGQLVPDLADGMPQISQDQKQYTINLKRGATWHNGQSITADDVVFTIQLLQDPAYKSPLYSLWQATTVEKLSDYSVRFTTQNISGPFLDNLTLPILPKSVWGNVSGQDFLLSKFNLEAVGSGPYAIKEIKKLPSGKVQEISLQANSNYFGGRPKIDNLVFKFYDTEADLLNAFHSRDITAFGFVPLGSSLFVDRSQSQAQITATPLPQYQVVFFNLRNKILGDQNVRQALAEATNRQEVIDQVFAGNALLPTSPWSTSGHPAVGQPALAAAENLLDSNGWKINPKTGVRDDGKGTTLQLTLVTNDTLVNSKAAELLAQAWRQLNITVNLSILPTNTLNATVIKPRSFDVLLFPQKFGPNPDPFVFWHSSQVKDPGLNLSGFSDPAADKLIIDARTTTDISVQRQTYQQFDDLITQKVPMLFLDQTEFVYAVDNSVHNVTLPALYDPSDRFNGIGNWYMDTLRVWK